MRESLNREAISRHELTIMVRDQGTPSKRALARVVITVQDHNDHAPEFLDDHYEGRLFETAVAGTNVLQVNAIDRDVGSNAEIHYSIASGKYIIFIIISVISVISTYMCYLSDLVVILLLQVILVMCL